MSETISEATGQRYGIQRVCQAWERSRPADKRAEAAGGQGTHSAGSSAQGVGREASGGDAGRSRAIAIPGRGSS